MGPSGARTVGLAALALALATPARAEDRSEAATGTSLDEVTEGLDRTGTPPPPPPVGVATSGAGGAPLPTGEKRPLPSYDGRAEEGADLGETLIRVPRAVFFPVHVVTEYGLRRPLVASLTLVEKHHLISRFERVFTWADGRAGFFPMFRLDLGLKPAVGFQTFADGVFHPDNDVVASASFWSDRLLLVKAQDSLRVFRERDGTVRLRASYLRRPDGVFYGMGGASRTADKTKFFFRRMEVATGLEGRLGGLNKFSVDVALRSARFDGSDVGLDDPNILSRFGGEGQAPLPPGFLSGYTLVTPSAQLVLDSRRPRDEHYEGSGVRLELDGAWAIDPEWPSATSFFTWGGEAAGMLDLSGYNHVVGLRVAARFSENVGDEPIPFTELPTLGGLELLRGFLAGRLVGASAIEATVEYRYPVWSFLDAELFTSVGNVFDGHLEGLAAERLLMAYGLSLRTTFSRESSVGLTVALGSNRFDEQDFRPADTLRVFVGVNQGF